MEAIGAWLIQIVFSLLGIKRAPPPSASERAGVAEQQAETSQSAAVTANAIAQAEAEAPRTPDAVIDKLKRGEF